MAVTTHRFLMASMISALALSGASIPLSTAHAQDTTSTSASQDLVSLDVTNTPIREALEQVFNSVKVQYSIDPNVVGNVTIKITNQTLDDALNSILRQSLVPATWSKENNVYVVKASAVPPTVQTPPATEPEKKPARHFYFGPEVGAYFPTSNKTRDVFGDTWFNFGVGIGNLRRSDPKGSFAADFGIISTRGSGRTAYIAPLGVSYNRALTKRIDVGPYVGASVDYVLTYLRADSEGLLSRTRGGGGGSVLIGTNFQERAYVQARYYAFSRIRGFDLSGLNVSAGYRF